MVVYMPGSRPSCYLISIRSSAERNVRKYQTVRVLYPTHLLHALNTIEQLLFILSSTVYILFHSIASVLFDH